MPIEIGGNIIIGGSIIIGDVPVITVFLIDENGDQLISETGLDFIEG